MEGLIARTRQVEALPCIRAVPIDAHSGRAAYDQGVPTILQSDAAQVVDWLEHVHHTFYYDTNLTRSKDWFFDYKDLVERALYVAAQRPGPMPMWLCRLTTCFAKLRATAFPVLEADADLWYKADRPQHMADAVNRNRYK
jgi:hypothetical protein